MSRVPCHWCSRTFADDNALYQHAKFRHGQKTKRSRREDYEESVAEIAIDASLKQSMREPLDELERSLLP